MSNVESNAYCPDCENIFWVSVNSKCLDVIHKCDNTFVYVITCPDCGHVGPEAPTFQTVLDTFNNCLSKE